MSGCELLPSFLDWVKIFWDLTYNFLLRWIQFPPLLRKSVRFFVIQKLCRYIFTDKELSKASSKVNETGQYPVWMTWNPRKGDFRGDPRRLSLQCSLRKSVSIYPRSTLDAFYGFNTILTKITWLYDIDRNFPKKQI